MSGQAPSPICLPLKSPMSKDMGRISRYHPNYIYNIIYVTRKFNAFVRNFLLVFQKSNSWMIFVAFRFIISHQSIISLWILLQLLFQSLFLILILFCIMIY